MAGTLFRSCSRYRAGLFRLEMFLQTNLEESRRTYKREISVSDLKSV